MVHYEASQSCTFASLFLLQAFTFEWYIMLPSVLWRCWLGGRKGKWWSVKNEWLGAGVVVCLEQGAHLHMAQLMPLLLTVSCLSKSRLVLPFWYRLTRVVLEKGPLNGCVCVCDILFNFGYVVQLPGLSTATCSLFELRTGVTLCWAGYPSFWLLVSKHWIELSTEANQRNLRSGGWIFVG